MLHTSYGVLVATLLQTLILWYHNMIKYHLPTPLSERGKLAGYRLCDLNQVNPILSDDDSRCRMLAAIPKTQRQPSEIDTRACARTWARSGKTQVAAPRRKRGGPPRGIYSFTTDHAQICWWCPRQGPHEIWTHIAETLSSKQTPEKHDRLSNQVQQATIRLRE